MKERINDFLARGAGIAKQPVELKRSSGQVTLERQHENAKHAVLGWLDRIVNDVDKFLAENAVYGGDNSWISPVINVPNDIGGIICGLVSGHKIFGLRSSWSGIFRDLSYNENSKHFTLEVSIDASRE